MRKRKKLNVSIALAKEKKRHRIRRNLENQRKESHVLYKKLGFEQQYYSLVKT